jgi:hypothetical protein
MLTSIDQRKDPSMNAHSSQPSVFLPRPLTERVVSEVGKVLRAAGALLAPISVQLSTPLVVVALIATVALGAAAQAADLQPVSKVFAKAQVVGVFTGEYVNGTPVYRLPPVIVVANREVARAKLEREKQLTRAEQARAKAAAKRPA